MKELERLEELYDSLQLQLELKKKHKYGSLMADMMKIKSNDRLNFLNDSAVDILDTKMKRALISNKYVKENEFGKYYISAIGIHKIELERNQSSNILIDFIDQEFFTNKSIDKGLKDSEKVILMTLIVIRTFNVDAALDLNSNDKIKDACGEILEYYNKKLYEYGVLKKYSKDFFGKNGNEHRVSSKIRHTEGLPKKTKMMYKNGHNKSRKYFLDISDGTEINVEDLKYLLEKIFDDKSKIDYEMLTEITDELINIAYEKGPDIYDNTAKTFIQPKYDTVISDAIEDVLLEL